MLMILTEEQVLPTERVCTGCLMADRSGMPRMRRGRLCCGAPITTNTAQTVPTYRCQMGFRLAEVERSNLSSSP